jgi:hypothetical protein
LHSEPSKIAVIIQNIVSSLAPAPKRQHAKWVARIHFILF